MNRKPKSAMEKDRRNKLNIEYEIMKNRNLCEIISRFKTGLDNSSPAIVNLDLQRKMSNRYE